MHSSPSTLGRPPKYGRPAKAIALTLPEDVLHWLSEIHPDPAWAIVTICERATKSRKPRPQVVPAAELVQLPKSGGLIVVKPDVFRDINGVSTIPLADGRALVAMANGYGIADLELALLEKLEEKELSADRRREIQSVRGSLREWRRSSSLTFQSRSIIMAMSSRGVSAKPIARLKRVGSSGRRRVPWLALGWWLQTINSAVNYELAEVATRILVWT